MNAIDARVRRLMFPITIIGLFALQTVEWIRPLPAPVWYAAIGWIACEIAASALGLYLRVRRIRGRA